MTFTPPIFTKLRINTLNLETKYSTLLGRYKIDDSPVVNSAAVKQTSLEILIARTNQVIQCKTNRETQRNVFKILVNELRHIPKEDENKTKQGTLFLLGALIHRYFRLISEYDSYNGYVSWTVFAACKVTDCKLFQAIRKALKFNELDVGKRFLDEDMKILDVVTIVEALEEFRDDMDVLDDKKVPRYKKYPHFAEDVNFKKYLQNIIDSERKRGASVLHRFKAIAFIKSLANEIEKERQQFEKEGQKWCTAIAKEYKDFKVFKNSGEGAINASLMKYVDSETSRNILFSLFYTPLIQENLGSMDHPTFFTKMKECYEHTCSYKLFGGYALVLQHSKSLDHDLIFAMQQALGLEKSISELTNEDLLNGIKFLKQFIEGEPDVALDYAFFDGKDRMNTAIARVEKELTHKSVEKSPPLESVGSPKEPVGLISK